MVRCLNGLVSAIVLLSGLPGVGGRVDGADWPQYRGDALRSGYTKERLPEKMQLA